jgi:hypothetical protein
MDQVYIRGTVDAHGGFSPGWWGAPPPRNLAAAETHSCPHTNWEAIALDEGDNILARAPTLLVAAPVCPGGSRLEFSALLAIPDTTSSVAIVHSDREVFRRAIPEPARLSLHWDFGTQPPRQLIEVPIRIDGPEPGSGAYMIAVWVAPGHTAFPLGFINVGAGQPSVVRLDLTELPGGANCRLSVIYCDGIRTVHTSSEPLTIELRPAVPVIESPSPEAQVFDDSWLSLEGRLTGDGDPQALQWLIDEVLVGTGPRAGVARPRAGTRVVTLRYGTARVSVKIGVLSAPVEVQPLLWAPPWRSTPFRFMSARRLGANTGKNRE